MQNSLRKNQRHINNNNTRNIKQRDRMSNKKDHVFETYQSTTYRNWQ